ncbi:hypothetical protein E2C01_026144 [Portunus trituberculatus]|uniref:Uncharacterized protein n=1 Tax=Portunus trituberculatus TaxID=210409 RepID=A0A5B7EJW7_PORTR|nr:hypothetical protein [Portunus trituberculatus]
MACTCNYLGSVPAGKLEQLPQPYGEASAAAGAVHLFTPFWRLDRELETGPHLAKVKVKAAKTVIDVSRFFLESRNCAVCFPNVVRWRDMVKRYHLKRPEAQQTREITACILGL